MEEEKNIAEKFMSVEKFISELIGFHEQIKQLKTSEAHYKELAGNLGETLKKYQSIVDHLPLKFFLKDKNLVYLLNSESYARFLGIAPQEVIGKTDHDFFPFEVAEQRLNEERRLMEVGKAEEKEERRTREGRTWVDQIIKTPIKNESGETLGIVGYCLDITAKKEKEEELERKDRELAVLKKEKKEERERRDKELALLQEGHEAKLKEIREKFELEQAERQQLEDRLKNVEALFPILFENTGTAVAMIKENRIISRVNREFEKLSGYSRAEVEGTKNWGEFIQNGSLQDMGEPAVSLSMNSLDPGMHMVKFVGKQNEGKTVSMTVALIPDSGSVLVSLKDITNYNKAGEELNRIMTQFRQMLVEMEKAAEDLHG
jgi:PAS domain S-box-containing protein